MSLYGLILTQEQIPLKAAEFISQSYSFIRNNHSNYPGTGCRFVAAKFS